MQFYIVQKNNIIFNSEQLYENTFFISSLVQRALQNRNEFWAVHMGGFERFV